MATYAAMACLYLVRTSHGQRAFAHLQPVEACDGSVRDRRVHVDNESVPASTEQGVRSVYV
eukprot:363132-Chlamydomonas_euryale.AAC.22